jgi:HEAT repeat protein
MAIPTLSRLLRDKAETENVRSEAALALGRIGPDALNVLVDILHSGPDTVARSGAANAIGKMGSKAQTATLHLIAALAEEDDQIWYNAGESLIAIGPTVLSPLRHAIESDNAHVRVHAGRTLMKLEPGHLSTVRAMLKDLKHTNSGVRRDAILALQTAGREVAAETVPSLTEALKDEDAFVREIAASCLAKIGPEAKSAIPALIKAMQDPEFEVRGYSATALGNVGMKSEVVVDALTRGINDEDGDVRILVARALGNIGPSAISAVPKLKAVLAEEDLSEELRLAVEKSIGQILGK